MNSLHLTKVSRVASVVPLPFFFKKKLSHVGQYFLNKNKSMQYVVFIFPVECDLIVQNMLLVLCRESLIDGILFFVLSLITS